MDNTRKTRHEMSARRFRQGLRLRVRDERGSSLLLVIWAIMMMSMAVMGLVEYLDRGIDDDIAETKRFRARLLAESGLVLAQHPAVKRGDPLLKQQVSATSSYHVRMTTEGARLAVNQFAAQPLLREVAQRLFEKWGFDPEQSRALVEAISDWVDADEEPRDYGAENEVYRLLGWPEYPPNHGFSTLEDVLLVRGMDEVERRVPDWRDRFTLYGDGKLDLNSLDPEMVEAAFDTTADLALTFVEHKFGPDGLPETEDDILYADFEETRHQLDLDEERFGKLQPVLTFAHPVRRIESRARVGDQTVTLTRITGGGANVVFER